MKHLKILLVAPYQNLADIFLETSKEFPEILLETFVGNLEDGIRYYQELIAIRNFDIILSRGGTASMLKDVSPIPIVDIEVSVYDMLRAIKSAEQYGQSFVVVGFANITETARLLRDMLNLSLDIRDISSSAEVEEYLSGLLAQGKNPLVLGDMVTVERAKALEMKNLLITSGKESAVKAFQDAITLHQNLRLVKRDGQMFRSILDNSKGNWVVFNSQGKIVYSNLSSADVNTLQLLDILSKNVETLKQKKQITLTRKRKGQRLEIYGTEIIEDWDSFYAFFIDFRSGLSNSMPSVISVNDKSGVSQMQDDLLCSPTYIQPIISAYGSKKFLKVLSTHTPIFIGGEPGTGKDSFAYSLYFNYQRDTSFFITINCPLLNEKVWQAIVNDPNSPLCGQGHTIYFKDVHALSPVMQKNLELYFEDTLLHNRHQIISSGSRNLYDLALDDNFMRALYSKLCGITVYLPALRNRKGDLPVFANMLIQRFNGEFSKQVIGFQSDALQLLCDYEWKLNMAQLKQIVRQLVIMADSYYISADQVNEALSSIKESNAPFSSLDLTRTLDEIERDIINRVLVDENMNQSSAAKRLGIGRTTLWRKLSYAPASTPGKRPRSSQQEPE